MLKEILTRLKEIDNNVDAIRKIVKRMHKYNEEQTYIYNKPKVTIKGATGDITFDPRN